MYSASSPPALPPFLPHAKDNMAGIAVTRLTTGVNDLDRGIYIVEPGVRSSARHCCR